MRNNESGFTFTELLAGICGAGVVLAVGTFVLHAIRFW